MTQMRLMAAQAKGVARADLASMQSGMAGASAGVGVVGGASGSFIGMLQNALGQVNELQQTSDSMAGSFERGSDQYSLAEVMIAKQKAGIAFQATVQVRNKLLESYKEVMNMQI